MGGTTWEALAQQHGRQVAPYLIPDEDRVIECACGDHLAPAKSELCRHCRSPLCPRCDHYPNVTLRAVCLACRPFGVWCDRYGEHAQFGGAAPLRQRLMAVAWLGNLSWLLRPSGYDSCQSPLVNANRFPGWSG